MAPTSTRQALEAVRTLATGLRTSGSNKAAAFTSECLEAAEALIQVTGPQGDEHAARLVLQWAVAVLGGRGGQHKQQQASQPSQGPAPPLAEAAKEERVWQVCRLAVTASSSSSLAATLPLASALGLLQAVSATVFSPSISTNTATAAVSVFATLTSRGLPQVPADKVLDLVADVVEQLYRYHQQQHQQHQHQQTSPPHSDLAATPAPSNGLGAAALQFLVAVQTQQANQRKAFTVLTSRVVQPLLALQQQQLQAHPKGAGGGGGGVVALRRAIDAVLDELLFHREHLEGLRALLAPGGKASGSSSSGGGGGSGSKKRQRAAAAAAAAAVAAKTSEAETAEGGGEAAATPTSPPPPPPQADKWASYQGQLLHSLGSWLNDEKDERTKKDVALSLGHLYRLFVRRLAAVAVMSMKDDLRVTKQQGAAQQQQQQQQQQQAEDGGGGDRGATAAAAAGQKRKEIEMAAAAASSSSLVSRPAFALGVKLWSLLWDGTAEQQQQQESLPPPAAAATTRAHRLVAARGVLEAMLQLNVYHYDSDQTSAGQYRAIESIFLDLLKSGGGGSREGGRGGERSTEMTGMEGEEVRCLATLLRIDHRVAETCLLQLLALLTQRFMIVNKLSSSKEEGWEEGAKEQQQQQQQQQHQVVASANNALRQVCARTMAEVVETYSRLRQNEVLLLALLSLEKSGDAAATALVGHPEVAAAVGRAVRDCPPPQLVPLWDLLAPTSSSSSSSSDSHDDEREHMEVEMEGEEKAEGSTPPTLGRPGVRSKLFGLFLDNVRVSSLNAPELGRRTTATMVHLTTVVLEHLGDGMMMSSGKEEGKKREKKERKSRKTGTAKDGEGTSDGSAAAAAATIGVALELYARLLEVRVMCDFWLDSSNSSSGSSCSGSSSSGSSSNINLSASSSSSGASLLRALLPHAPRLPGCKGAVDRLVIGRLRQLLLETGVRGVGAAGTPESVAALADAEQRELVAFLFQGHARDDPNDDKGQEGNVGERQHHYHHYLNLSLLGASLPLWASHCETEHLDLLWGAVFSDSLAFVRSQKPNPNRPSIRLLTDAAFYEMAPLAYRCVPSWSRVVLECLMVEVGGLEGGKEGKEGGVLEEVEGWMEGGEVKALLLATEQVLSSSPPAGVASQGKGKRGQAAAAAAAAAASGGGGSSLVVQWAVAAAAGKATEGGEDAITKAVHCCRLLNSLPQGYLPPEHEPLRFLLSILLSRVLARTTHTHAFARTLHLTLSASALLALQRAPQTIVPLIATSMPLLEKWLVKLVLPARAFSPSSSSFLSSSAASKSVGLELLDCYLRCLVKQDGGAGGEQQQDQQQQQRVAHLLQALVKQGLVSNLDKVGDTKEEEGDVRHALRVVRVLLSPYLGGNGRTAGGREAVVELVAEQVGPAVTRRLSSSLSSETLRASAALLQLMGRTTKEEEREEGKRKRKGLGSFSLPSQVVARVLAKVTTMGGGGEEEENSDGVMDFLAAYLQWGERKEGHSDGGARDEEGVILEEMVRLAVLPSSSLSSLSSSLLSSAEKDQHATSVAPAIGHARGGMNIQLQALRRLTQLLDAVQIPSSSSSSSSSSQDKEEAVGGAAETLARTCLLFEQLVEQGGMGEGPGAEAVRQIAQPFLGHVTQLLAALMGRMLSGRTSNKSNVGAVMLEGLLRGLNVLRLYVRKRWLFPSGGGMRVEDVGRLLACVASLPQALQGMEREEEDAGGEQGSSRKEEVFGAACSLLSALLKHHPRLVYQCAPPFFFLTRALLRALLAGAAGGGWGPTAAKAWTRLAEHLAGHATPLRRHLMLLVVDYLNVCPHLGQELKGALQPAAFALMDTLTPFEVQHMHAALLDAAGQALLKKLHSDYQQRYKYRGKV